MKKKLILIFIIGTGAVTLIPSETLSNQMGLGRALGVNAVGISVDYARTKDKNDTGLYVSYRYGFAHFISLYFSADLGYRFISSRVNARVGGQAMFLFVGLEAGFLCAYRTKKEHVEWFERTKPPGPWSPGMYIGLAGAVPIKPVALFLSLGGNFYFINNDHEFYFMVSGLFNFAGDVRPHPAPEETRAEQPLTYLPSNENRMQ